MLVNLPAQAMPALSLWFDCNDVLEMADEADVLFYSWFVSDCGVDSLALFEQLLDKFDDRVRHIFVANYGMTKKWELLTKNEALVTRMKRLGVTMVKFPKFVGRDDRNRINELSLTFEQVQGSNAFDAFGRQHVKSFLKAAFAQFDQTGVFDGE